MDLSMLNKEQRIAAETMEGPVLILAGAGSGKTRALTYRLANLIDHGTPAWAILALTFTNKAAREMKTRVEGLIGTETAADAWISTFHSTCARILRRDIEKLGYSRSFAIYDDDDQGRVMKEIYKQLNIDDAYLPIREVRGKISDAKNKLLTPDEWFRKTSRDRRNSQIHDVMVTYETRMKTLNALDFDDLLMKTLELFADHPPVLEAYRRRFRYVMVDEYQDTNKAQYELVRLITAESRNLCVVGDDDQSIYGWRGADIRNILDFEKDYPDAKVIKLEQNYRSTSTILDAANQVIVHNEGRKDKKLWTESEAGEKIRVYCAEDDRDESLWIAQKIQELHRGGESYGTCAVLYRANAQSRIPEETLMRTGIPYRIFGGQKFYERKEVKDILAYLRVIVNPADDISLSRIINVPRRAIGDTTVQALQEHAARENMPLFSAMINLPEGLGSRAKNSVTEFFKLMTLLMAMKETMGLEEFVDLVIDRTGLESQYIKENTEEARDRLDNMEEFRSALHEYAENEENATLEGYLENAALVTDLDRAETEGTGAVTLMTLHSAKGLEFENVFIPGMEENVFPSFRSVSEEYRLEEERRLMYVGITRAKKRLYLTHARMRMTYNQYNHNAPSRFLDEIPDRLTEHLSYDDMHGYGRQERRGIPGGMPRRSEETAKESGAGWRRSSTTGNGGFSFGGAASEGRKPVSRFAIGPKDKPMLPPDRIPGVTKGISAPLQKLFTAGDRVRHPKFGAGTVTEVSGSGKDARIRIAFETAGEKELALAIAPIVKTED